MCILSHTHLLVPAQALGQNQTSAAALLTTETGVTGCCREGIRLLTSPHTARDCGDPKPLGQEGVWGGGTIHPRPSASWRCARQNLAPARAMSSLGTLQPPPPPHQRWDSDVWRALQGQGRAATGCSSASLPSILQG